MTTFSNCRFSDKSNKITKVECSITVLPKNDANKIIRVHFDSGTAASSIWDTERNFYLETNYKFTKDNRKTRIFLRSLETDKVLYKLMFQNPNTRNQAIEKLEEWSSLKVEIEKKQRKSVFNIFKFAAKSGSETSGFFIRLYLLSMTFYS